MAGDQDLLLPRSAVTSYCLAGVQCSREPVTALTAMLCIRFILGGLMAAPWQAKPIRQVSPHIESASAAGSTSQSGGVRQCQPSSIRKSKKRQILQKLP